MAYDEMLAEKLRDILDQDETLVEKKMFGGLAFLSNGNMAVGVSGDSLIVRVGADGYEAAIAEPGVDVFGKAGSPMTGWVLVSPSRLRDEPNLRHWVDRGMSFASTLPPK